MSFFWENFIQENVFEKMTENLDSHVSMKVGVTNCMQKETQKQSENKSRNLELVFTFIHLFKMSIEFIAI